MKSKLIISKNLSQKVNYLHSVHGKVEWSGALLFSVEEGDITNPSKLILKAQDLYLMDVGSSAYTEYEMGTEITKLYAKFPQADQFICAEKGIFPWKVGQIHTHHNMGAFFSPTDEKELRTNAPNHSYYLSLIVDWKCEYKARIGIYGSVEEEKTYTWKDGSGNDVKVPTKSKSEKVFEIECDIEFEGVDDIAERLKEIKSIKKSKRKNTVRELSELTFNRTPLKSPREFDHQGNDISPNQQELVPKGEYVSKAKVEEYLLNLVVCGSQRKYLTLEEAFIDLENLIGTAEYEMWESMLFDNADNVFNDSFDSTFLELSDIAEKCFEVLSDYYMFNSAHTVTGVMEAYCESYFYGG
jgi:hypothetical protein